MATRKEQKLQSKKRILDSALREFSEQGYGLSSINTICSEGDISKGVLYHYYESKDALYLACIEQCFDSLTEYLQRHLGGGSPVDTQDYFNARRRFFEENPVFQRLFCEAIVYPPTQLKAQIGKIKERFDALNMAVMSKVLEGVDLRGDISREQALEVFRMFQDFVNVNSQMLPDGDVNLTRHEEISSRTLSVLLYGLVEREGVTNE